jgi:CHAD domain-containing protein
MQAVSHDIVVTGDGQPGRDSLAAALAPRYSVMPGGRTRTVRRTWLDTFDWRLYRGGLTLTHATGHGHGTLTLSTRPGGELAVRPGRLRWPAFPAAIPAGPLRQRVAEAAGIRALVPAARTVSTVSSLRVCNSDGKTIAWLTVDAMWSPAARNGPALTRLTVTPVRGYQAQADAIARRVASIPGGQPGGAAVVVAAFATDGRQPGDYSSKMDVDLTPGMPARLALGTVLLRLLDTVAANVPGTLRDIDTEFLHDLRVSVRRSRSALKLAGAALPGGLAQEFRAEFKWLGDATTPTRDLDVYLLGYDSMAASLDAAPAAELAPFHDFLATRREAERRRLVRALRSARFENLVTSWRKALTGMAPPRGGPDAAHLAAAVVGKAHRRVLRAGDAITPSSPPESLHDLRKRCKELRYGLEFFSPLFDPALHRQAVRELKGLQDCLGAFQDSQVQQHHLAESAQQMMAAGGTPVTAFLAMGELAGHVAGQGHAARGEFTGRFAEFASQANRRRFRDLTTSVLS